MVPYSHQARTERLICLGRVALGFFSIVAAWVTAQARLKLYSYLEPLGDRVLYMDTGKLVIHCGHAFVDITPCFQILSSI